mmetsp:Transcript_18366/g.50979  ORF Transcript_18366/g.50979 Transcript_18366/m.50979 type:complete len:106 (+) Transcript_18366:390-707(+)
MMSSVQNGGQPTALITGRLKNDFPFSTQARPSVHRSTQQLIVLDWPAGVCNCAGKMSRVVIQHSTNTQLARNWVKEQHHGTISEHGCAKEPRHLTEAAMLYLCLD